MLLLRRRVEPFRGASNLRLAANQLYSSLSFAYLVGRRNSRQHAADETTAELVVLAGLFGRQLMRPTGLVPETDARQAYDSWRARRAARGYAEHWLADAELVGADEAVTVQSWRLGMGAATESADAWAAEREAALDRFAAEQPWAAAQFYRVWDATMDRRTCQICSHAHGSIVRIDEQFPDGRPGGVHPNCRCTEQILTADEADLDYYAWAA